MTETMTPVLRILQTVEYSVDFYSIHDFDGDTEDEKRTAFWQEVLDVKSADTGFGYLVEAMLENGWQSGSEIGWNPDTKTIHEGHHRLVAAILLGIDEVPTSLGGRNSYDDEGNRLSAHTEGWNKSPYPIELD